MLRAFRTLFQLLCAVSCLLFKPVRYARGTLWAGMAHPAQDVS